MDHESRSAAHEQCGTKRPMAQVVITQFVDDLSGAVIAEGDGETVSFALDGQQYSIDLTSKNADKMRKAFAEYVAAAAKVGRRTGRTARSGQSGGPSAREIRDWAKRSGFEVPDRGRIPASVREAFQAAH
jgi:hypothetical protein